MFKRTFGFPDGVSFCSFDLVVLPGVDIIALRFFELCGVRGVPDVANLLLPVTAPMKVALIFSAAVCLLNHLVNKLVHKSHMKLSAVESRMTVFIIFSKALIVVTSLTRRDCNEIL